MRAKWLLSWPASAGDVDAAAGVAVADSGGHAGDDDAGDDTGATQSAVGPVGSSDC